MEQNNSQCQKEELGYQTDVQYLEDHFRILDLLITRREMHEKGAVSPRAMHKISQEIAKKNKDIEKKRLVSLRNDKIFRIEQMADKYHLDEIEKKIVIFLLYRYFNTDNVGTTGRVLLETITNGRMEMMHSRHYLMEDGRLYSHRLIYSHELVGEGSVLDVEFSLPEEIISQLLGEKKIVRQSRKAKNSQEKSYKSYLNLYFSYVQLLEKKAELLMIIRNESDDEDLWDIDESNKELGKIRYNLRKTKSTIEKFRAEEHSYPLEQVVSEHKLSQDEKMVLLILLRDSLGLSDTFMGCEGKKLLAILSGNEDEIMAKRSLLYKEGKLRANKLIEMERGWAGQNLMDAEYFLSEKMIRRLLGQWNENDKHEEEDCVECEAEDENQILATVTPRFQFSDVILDDKKKKTIEIALSQQKNHSLIFDTWGLAKKIPYGNSLTMLFSGAPGTGKTMMAEAIAGYLGKKLLVANYARIQNMYVGETEKRIVATFKKARESHGILLWDEADAMFYSREFAGQSWEFRDVNVILQEIEKFEGVVILTTNRKVSLDRALERRLALKVTFEMPDMDSREKIWKQLLPKEAFLEGTIDFAHLAKEYEVSGGTIKNAILQAARYAAYRGSSHVTMDDLLYGIKTELEDSWEAQSKIGFSTDTLGTKTNSLME